MKFPFIFVALSAFTLAFSNRAETVPDRKAAVLKHRATLENDPRWIYNDYERGFAQAEGTGKPLLVVIRCIPCLACAGLDARVLLDNSDLSPLLDQFVWVRVVNADALVLSRFQFHFDLSFTTLIFNGDGTLYGRYGSWTHQKSARRSHRRFPPGIGDRAPDSPGLSSTRLRRRSGLTGSPNRKNVLSFVASSAFADLNWCFGASLSPGS